MSNPKLRIRKGDQILVVTGKEKGRVSTVRRVLPASRQVVVDGVRRVRRHMRPVGDQPGGVVEKEMPIDISNVALWNDAEKRRVKVGFKQIDGKKVRVDRKTGASLDKD